MPMPAKTYHLDVLVTQLFDMLMSAPRGITVDDMAAKMGISRRWAHRVIKEFRDLCGRDETINLVAQPQGRGPWRYTLAGTLMDAEWWEANRVGDAETRLNTMAHVLASIVRNTDSRSMEGRKARIMHRCIKRAQEDLADLAAAVEPVRASR